MNPLRKKLCVAGAVLVIAVGYLVYAGIKLGSSYFLSVDEFLAGAQYHSQHVQLHGKVGGRDDIVHDQSGQLARFKLLGEKRILPVAYSGAVPDLFKPGCEVVVKGRLGTDGVFQADELLTKCASKYEEDPDTHSRTPT